MEHELVRFMVLHPAVLPIALCPVACSSVCCSSNNSCQHTYAVHDMQAAHQRLIVGAVMVGLLLCAGSLQYIRHIRRELGLATSKSQFWQRTRY